MNDLFSEEEIHPPLAPKHARIFASIIDYLIYIFANSLIYGEWSSSLSNGISIGLDVINPNVFLCVFLWVLLLPAAEGTFGQTLGKRLLRVRVLSADYKKVSYGQAIVRHLADILDWLPFFGILGIVVATLNKQNKRIGDLFANTIVVDSMPASKIN